MSLRRGIARTLLRMIVGLSLSIIAAGIGWIVLINHPQLVFGYCVSGAGIKLCSDRPLPSRQAQLVLANVASRLRAVNLHWKGQRVAVIAQDRRLERIVFFTALGGGGVNHYPYSSVAFVRPSILRANRLIAPDGTIIEPPRTLSYFIAHEVAHGLYGERVGPVGFWSAQRWSWEGAADYAGHGGAIDLARNRHRLQAGHDAMNYERSGLYDSYSSIVAFLVKRCGQGIADILASQSGYSTNSRRFEEDDCSAR